MGLLEGQSYFGKAYIAISGHSHLDSRPFRIAEPVFEKRVQVYDVFDITEG